MISNNNIFEADLMEIIHKFFPLYEQLDDVNKKIVHDSYRIFFEKALEYSFNCKANGIKING